MNGFGVGFAFVGKAAGTPSTFVEEIEDDTQPSQQQQQQQQQQQSQQQQRPADSLRRVAQQSPVLLHNALRQWRSAGTPTPTPPAQLTTSQTLLASIASAGKPPPLRTSIVTSPAVLAAQPPQPQPSGSSNNSSSRVSLLAQLNEIAFSCRSPARAPLQPPATTTTMSAPSSPFPALAVAPQRPVSADRNTDACRARHSVPAPVRAQCFGGPKNSSNSNKGNEEEEEDAWEREEENEDEIECDLEAAKTWVYPVNLPKREYQYSVVRDALFENTLVCLPTGLGKTFIAAVVMLNYYRWFPAGKVVFVAHTRPLVRQQISACREITGIPAAAMCELTGQVKLAQRAECWRARRVFFLTPQVLANDVASGVCPAAAIRCVVFDEAHRSVGNSAYVQVVQSVAAHTRRFRCVGLTASPGSSVAAVQAVVDNLRAARLAVRTESDADVAPYLHSKDVDVVTVHLSPQLRSIRALYEPLLRDPVNRLVSMGLFYDRALERLTPFQLLEQRRALDAREAQLDPNVVAAARTHFAAAVTLAGPYRLLLTQGLGPFAAALHKINDDGLRGTARYKRELVSSDAWKLCLAAVASALTQPADGHPKMTELRSIVANHFARYQQEHVGPGKDTGTRAIVFATYRESVLEITRMLARVPGVRPASFIGQAAGRSGAGLRQRDQLDTLAHFRAGTCNVLVATVIGEEGLDVGEVDLIVCYDSAASPTRLVQRFGRTGRKRDGRVVVLVTEGEEEVAYRRSRMRSHAIMRSLTSNPKLRLCPPAPRVLPAACHPVPVEVNIVADGSAEVPTVAGNEGEVGEEDLIISEDSSECKVPLQGDEVDDFLDQDMIDKLIAEQMEVPPAAVAPAAPLPVAQPLKPEPVEVKKSTGDEDDIVFPEAAAAAAAAAPVVVPKKEEEKAVDETDEIVYPDLSTIPVVPTKKEKKRKKSGMGEDRKEQKQKQHKHAEKPGIAEFFKARPSPPKTAKKVETTVPAPAPVPPVPTKSENKATTTAATTEAGKDKNEKHRTWVLDVEDEDKSVSVDVKPVRGRSYFMSLLGFDTPQATQEAPSEPQAKKKRLVQLSDSESSQSSALSSQSPLKSAPRRDVPSTQSAVVVDVHDLLDDEAEVSDDGHAVSSDEDEGGSSQDRYSQSFVTEDVVYDEAPGTPATPCTGATAAAAAAAPSPVNERAMYAQSLSSSGSSGLFGTPRFAPAGSKLVFTHMPHSKVLRQMLGEVGEVDTRPVDDPLLRMDDDDDDDDDDDVQIIDPAPAAPAAPAPAPMHVPERVLVLQAPDCPATDAAAPGTRVLRLGYALETLYGVPSAAVHVWCAFGTPARAWALVRVAAPLDTDPALARRATALLRRFAACHVVVAMPPGTPAAPTAALLRAAPHVASVATVDTRSAGVAPPPPPPLGPLVQQLMQQLAAEGEQQQQQEGPDDAGGAWARVLGGLRAATLTAQEGEVRALAQAAPAVPLLALAVVVACLGSFEAVRNADVSTLVHRCALPPRVANALYGALDFC